MADIFISYARPDRPVAEALARDLTSRGYSVWWDAELVGSDDYAQVILEALQQAKAAIVIWTKDSAKSRFVRDEARFALHLEKLVATRAPGLDVYSIPFGFQSQHTDDVNNREQILRAIHKLGVQPAAATAAALAAPSNGWDQIKAAGTIEDIVAFLGTNPPDPQKREAMAQLKQLAAGQPAVAGKGSSAIRSLMASNLQAFFSGLTLQIPKFQLSTQGTWTSIGAALAYSAVAVIVTILIVEFLGSNYTKVGYKQFLMTIVFGITVVFLWERTGTFLRQRNFSAAIIISVVFVCLASITTLITAAWVAEARLIDIDYAMLFSLFGAPLLYSILVIRRILAYR